MQLKKQMKTKKIINDILQILIIFLFCTNGQFECPLFTPVFKNEDNGSYIFLSVRKYTWWAFTFYTFFSSEKRGSKNKDTCAADNLSNIFKMGILVFGEFSGFVQTLIFLTFSCIEHDILKKSNLRIKFMNK